MRWDPTLWGALSLGELVRRLETLPPERAVKFGFGKPNSYRGYYDELAFEPETDVTVGSMLEHARSALGKTFEGYKGGTYAMHEHTPVWVSPWGDSSGAQISGLLLSYMVGEIE